MWKWYFWGYVLGILVSWRPMVRMVMESFDEENQRWVSSRGQPLTQGQLIGSVFIGLLVSIFWVPWYASIGLWKFVLKPAILGGLKTERQKKAEAEEKKKEEAQKLDLAKSLAAEHGLPYPGVTPEPNDELQKARRQELGYRGLKPPQQRCMCNSCVSHNVNPVLPWIDRSTVKLGQARRSTR